MNLENITKIYQTKNSEIVALNNITYHFEPGKFYAIMGHSGSGKSTLISILGLIENYTSGKYFLENRDVANLSDEELSQLRMEKIGFIFQDYYLDENLKAFENVILPMTINPKIPSKERKNKAFQLLDKIGLSNRINHFPNELSGGEQQRVAIARSLANNPSIIIADEPTGNLDRENEELIFHKLKDLSEEGKCIIVVSHSEEIKKYADVIISIESGNLII